MTFIEFYTITKVCQETRIAQDVEYFFIKSTIYFFLLKFI